MKTKIISIIIILVVSILSFFGTFYLGINDVLGVKIFGLTIGTMLPIVIEIILSIIIVYDFISIRLKRMRYGELKYVLKRTNKKVQVIGFLILVAILIFEAVLIAVDISFLYMLGMLPLMFGYHNMEKEGLGDKCIYQWGIPTKWSNVRSYNFEGNILTLNVTKKYLWMTQDIKIPFKVEKEQQTEILDYVKSRVGI